MRFALRRQTGFSHLNHQVKKATLSFCRVIGIFLPVLMLLSALGLRHSGSGKPRHLCCTLAPWADTRAKVGLLSRPRGAWGARGCAPKVLLSHDHGFLRKAKQQALKIPILTTAGATERSSRPQCCRPRTTCNSRRRLRQAAAANSSGCATKARASPTSPSRRSRCSPTSAPGSRRTPSRRSRLLSR